MPDLTDTIAEEAALPLKSSSDGQEAEGRSLADLIAADKYLKSVEAAAGTNAKGGPKSAWRGVRMARAIPPSATGGA